MAAYRMYSALLLPGRRFTVDAVPFFAPAAGSFAALMRRRLPRSSRHPRSKRMA